jgi:alkylated DNA repair dioxygenase AlkB
MWENNLHLVCLFFPQNVMKRKHVENQEEKKEIKRTNKKAKNTGASRRLNKISWRSFNSSTSAKQTNSWVTYNPLWLSQIQANALQAELKQLKMNGKFQAEEVFLYGKKHIAPRLTLAMAPQEAFGEGARVPTYRYAGKNMVPIEATPLVQQVFERLKKEYPEEAPSYVLLNFYRNNKDNIGWHSDDEKDLKEGASIFSVNLGATRVFQWRDKEFSSKDTYECKLEHGSLFVMGGDTQKWWKHRAPPQNGSELGERINMTFRVMHRSLFAQ